MESLILIALLLAVFYFLLIRPQQKQRRHLQDVQSSLDPGTKVMTGSGLIGTVVSVENDQVELEVSPGVTNTYVRRAIVQVMPDESANPDVGTSEPGMTLNESGAEANDKPDDSTR